MKIICFFAVLLFSFVGTHLASHAMRLPYAVSGVQVPVTQNVTAADIPLCQEDFIQCTSVIPNKASGVLTCDGTSNVDGGWVASGLEGQSCLKSLRICYQAPNVPSKCFILNQNDLPATVNFEGVKYANTFSACMDVMQANNPESVHKDQFYKEYCVWKVGADGLANKQYAERRIRGESVKSKGKKKKGLTGLTGDDMFSLAKGSSGIMEYLDVSGQYGLKYISRSASDPETRRMMVPSGPAKTYSDYKHFLDNPPDHVAVKDACYAAKVNITCDFSNVNLPPHCGASALQNFLFRPSPNNEDLCLVGEATAVSFGGSDNRLAYEWTCE